MRDRVKWVSACVMLAFQLSVPLVVHAASDDPILTYFQGGTMTLGVEFNSMLVTGAGAGSVVSGAAAPNKADPFSVFRGPAGMRYVRGTAAIGFTMHPQFLVPFHTLPFEVQTVVDESVDGFTENFQKNSDAFDYPSFGGSLARSTSAFSSFGMVVPAGGWRFGFGYSNPLHLELDMLLGGFRQRIDTVESNPDEAIGFAIQTKVSNRLSINADRWGVALSRDLGRHFTFGVSGSRTLIEIGWLGGYNVEGIMTRGTQQYVFNSSTDPWYNNLHAEADGGYTGFLYTMHAGFIISSSSDHGWRLGLDYTHQSQPVLRGGMFLLVDEFPALKLETEGDEEPFDANRIADVTEITRTYPNQYLTSDEMHLGIPSALTLTISKGAGLRPTLTVTRYMGSGMYYELEMQEKRVDETEYRSRLYSRGLKPAWQAYFGIHPGFFFLGLGAITAEDLVGGYVDGNSNPIPGGNSLIIPRLDLGVSFRIKGNLNGELLLTGLPEDLLRVALVYDF